MIQKGTENSDTREVTTCVTSRFYKNFSVIECGSFCVHGSPECAYSICSETTFSWLTEPARTYA